VGPKQGRKPEYIPGGGEGERGRGQVGEEQEVGGGSLLAFYFCSSG